MARSQKGYEIGWDLLLPQMRTRARHWGLRLKASIEYFIYAYIFTSILVVGMTLDHVVSDRFMTQQRQFAEAQLASLSAKISGDLSSKTIISRGLAALIKRDPNITKAQFEEAAAEMARNNSGLINIALAPDLITRYVYPERQNQAVLGFDLRASPSQYPDVAQARDTGRTIISGPFPLVQGGRGFIVRTPVFLIDPVTAKSTFWGIVSAVMDTEHFFATTGLSNPDLPLDVALRRIGPEGNSGRLLYGDRAIFDMRHVSAQITLPSGNWELAATPKGGWSHDVPFQWLYRLLYVAASVLLLAMMRHFYVLLRQRRRAEQRLNDAINAMEDGFVLYDEQNRFVVCNRKYAELYDKTPDLLVPGTPFETIIREGFRSGQFANNLVSEDEWVRTRLEAFKAGRSASEEQLSDGRWLKVTDQRTPDGCTVGLRVDITELKAAMEAAQAASVAKSDFLNVLSHELRTPLTVILGNARVLGNLYGLPQVRRLREKLAAAGGEPALLDETDATLTFLRDLARKSEASSEHLLRLITEMLDFAKIEVGQMELNREPLTLPPLVEDVLEGFQAIAAKKSLELVCDVGTHWVSADRLRLNQILINLVGNAMKFTDRGEVRVSAAPKGPLIEISVSDTGCGIAAEHQDLIFEAFRQIDGSSTRKAGGTGLGLSITKRLVELHGGRIEVVSPPGGGSTFRFTLPCATARYEASAEEAPATGTATSEAEIRAKPSAAAR